MAKFTINSSDRDHSHTEADVTQSNWGVGTVVDNNQQVYWVLDKQQDSVDYGAVARIRGAAASDTLAIANLMAGAPRLYNACFAVVEYLSNDFADDLAANVDDAQYCTGVLRLKCIDAIQFALTGKGTKPEPEDTEMETTLTEVFAMGVTDGIKQQPEPAQQDESLKPLDQPELKQRIAVQRLILVPTGPNQTDEVARYEGIVVAEVRKMDVNFDNGPFGYISFGGRPYLVSRRDDTSDMLNAAWVLTLAADDKFSILLQETPNE